MRAEDRFCPACGHPDYGQVGLFCPGCGGELEEWVPDEGRFLVDYEEDSWSPRPAEEVWEELDKRCPRCGIDVSEAWEEEVRKREPPEWRYRSHPQDDGWSHGGAYDACCDVDDVSHCAGCPAFDG
ncbi:MAG: hypothetical protein JXX28_11525 [Deltaproteobacteria bacterium]|nr:hypothetical protein [Deltaproteobacteria bacterium]